MESGLHEALKKAVFAELEKEGYDLHVEPFESPLERLGWSCYRPDILGVACDEAALMLVLVECETNPRMRNMQEKASKIKKGFTLQKRLNENHLLRLLLVVPPGMLHKVNFSAIRRLWEIWIVSGTGGIVHRIPQGGKLEA